MLAVAVRADKVSALRRFPRILPSMPFVVAMEVGRFGVREMREVLYYGQRCRK